MDFSLGNKYSTFSYIIVNTLFNRYDNFAHIGGFVGGLMISLIVLPVTTVEYPSSNSKESATRLNEQTILLWMMRVMAIAFISILIWIALHIFFEGEQNVHNTAINN